MSEPADERLTSLPSDSDDVHAPLPTEGRLGPLSHLVDGSVRNRHAALIVLILGLAAVVGGVGVGLLAALVEEPFRAEQYFSIGCLGVLVAWWTVYFNFEFFGIANLRAFLRDKNPYRADGKPVEHVDIRDDAESNVVTKAAFSVGAQGILIAIIALFLDLVLGADEVDAYQTFLRPVIVFTALLTILTMVLAIDILDTAANVYASGKWTPFQYRRWFNSGVGPPFPRGGASYAYYGFALFSAYIVMGLMFFYPLMAGFGVAIYTYLGYPFLFGYVRTVDGSGQAAVEIDESAGRASIFIGGGLLAATILAGVVT